MQTETLRNLLRTPALLSTQASLLLMPSSGECLLRSLAPWAASNAVVLANSDRAEDYVTATTKKKENLNGYL